MPAKRQERLQGTAYPCRHPRRHRPQQSKQRLLTPDRLAALLQTLADRQAAKTEAVDRRLITLQREVVDCDERLRRLYLSIEDGIVELDDILRERTAALKSERERAKAALDRARAQCGTVTTIDSAKIDTFARLMNEKLDNGDTSARKAYIARSSTPLRWTITRSGLLAAGTFCGPGFPVNRPRTGMFVVLYGIKQQTRMSLKLRFNSQQNWLAG